MLDPEHARLVHPGGNGVFGATIVINGRMAGTWRRTLKKGGVQVTACPFVPFSRDEKRAFAAAAEAYARFLGAALIAS